MKNKLPESITYTVWIVFDPYGKPIRYTYSNISEQDSIALYCQYGDNLNYGYTCKKIEFKVIEK